MKDKIRKEAFQMSGEWLLHETTVHRLLDEYTLSLRKELEEAKAKISELEKEVQIKQTAIDALLDPEF